MSIPANRLLLALMLLVPMTVMSVLSWDRSLTGDEGLTVFVTGGDTATLVDNVSRDNHPPLYYFMMWGWTRIFGNSLGSLRSFALVPTLLIILLAVLLLPVHAAVLLAFSPFLLHLGVELRMYGFLALAGMLQLLAIRYEISKRSVASIVLLVLSLAAGTWIHHFGWLGVAAAFTLMALKGRWRRGVIVAAAVILLYLPWAQTALRQWSSFGGEAMEGSTVYLQSTSPLQRLAGMPFSIGGTLIRFCAGTAGIEFQQFSPSSVDAGLVIAAALTAMMVFMAWKGRGRENLPAVLLLLWILIPLSFLRPSARHFSLAFTSFILLAATGLERTRGRFGKLLIAVPVIAMLAFQIRFVNQPVMPQRCTFQRDLNEAAEVAGRLASEEGCPVIAHLDHYTSMSFLYHLDQLGYGDLEVRTHFDEMFGRGHYFMDDPFEALGYLRHDTDSMVTSWLHSDTVFVLLANDPSRARGRIFGSTNRFIGMGSDVMSDLDLMESLREHGEIVSRSELRNSRGPFSVFLVRKSGLD